MKKEYDFSKGERGKFWDNIQSEDSSQQKKPFHIGKAFY